LILAAGGRITDVDGNELRFNKPSVKLKGMIASNGRLHGELERMLSHGGQHR
jgi:3'-phosphoadenosine 5'-phosphosulfate (PAPS) 3'-phosphatase